MADIRPLALQLWTVRDALAADRSRALQRVAEIGFRAVEPFGIGGAGAAAAERVAASEELRRQLDDNGLTACAVHGRVPGDDELDAVFDEVAALGADTLIAPAPGQVDGCEDAFASRDGLRQLADRLNAAAARGAAYGISVGYHNHWAEWDALPDGTAGYDVLWEHADPAVVAEVDVYWAQVGGQEPGAVIASLGQRAQLLHVKDGPAEVGSPQLALGEGVLDLPAILAAGTHVRWHVVELDDCATDVVTAASLGGQWLVANGWSRWSVPDSAH